MAVDNGSFAKLRDVLDLYKAGRKHAAKAKWLELQEDFRRRVMEVSLEANMNPPPMDYQPIRMQSEFGSCTIAWTVVDDQTLTIKDLVDVIPELACA